MTPDDLSKAITIMLAEVSKRRGLGGYSQEAESILLLYEMLLLVLKHLKGEEGETGNKASPAAGRKGR